MELRAVIEDPVDLRTAVDLLYSKHCPETAFRIKQQAFLLAASAEINDYTGKAFAVRLAAFRKDGTEMGWRKFELWKLKQHEFIKALGAWYLEMLTETQRQLALNEAEIAARRLSEADEADDLQKTGEGGDSAADPDQSRDVSTAHANPPPVSSMSSPGGDSIGKDADSAPLPDQSRDTSGAHAVPPEASSMSSPSGVFIGKDADGAPFPDQSRDISNGHAKPPPASSKSSPGGDPIPPR